MDVLRKYDVMHPCFASGYNNATARYLLKCTLNCHKMYANGMHISDMQYTFVFDAKNPYCSKQLAEDIKFALSDKMSVRDFIDLFDVISIEKWHKNQSEYIYARNASLKKMSYYEIIDDIIQ